MNWPPVKAWTSKFPIDEQIHFVAINYGGKLLKRWVVLMSVIDSSLLIKVSWSELIDSSNWESGWCEINSSNSSESDNKMVHIKTTNFTYLSSDSGLTIPMTKNPIRPWFESD